MKNHLLFEIRNSQWALREETALLLEATANKLFHDKTFQIEPTDVPIRAHTGAVLTTDTQGYNPFDTFEENTIAIIPLSGIMTKRSSWYTYGTDMIAHFIRMADLSPKVTGVIILADTPGGSVTSVFQLQDALSNMTKPNLTLIDGYLCSAGVWAMCFSQRILAMHEMNVIGSIGVMQTLVDDTQQQEKWGLKVRSVYPPESSYKNLAYRKALDDNDDKILIEEVLSPLAVNFQQAVIKHRPNLDQKVEGILEGKEFYAQDAIKYGLIDGITSLDGAVEMIQEECRRRENIIHSL